MLAVGQMATSVNESYFLMVLLYLKPLFTVLGGIGLSRCTTLLFALSWSNCPILILISFYERTEKKLRLFSTE